MNIKPNTKGAGNTPIARLKSLNSSSGVCCVCNKEAKSLSNHVLLKHVKQGDIESLQQYYQKYVLKTDIIPVCLNCKGKVEFRSVKKGYKRVCCHKCAMNAPTIKAYVQDKSKEGLRKLGVENASQLPGWEAKIKKTKLERYGNEKYVNIEQRDKTMIERYGAKVMLQTEAGKEKVKKTNRERYGTDWQISSEQTKLKAKNTIEANGGYAWQNLEKRKKFVELMGGQYGGIGWASEELMKKIKKTNLKRYGFENHQQNEQVIRQGLTTKFNKYGNFNNTVKIKQTVKEKYGVDNVMQHPPFFEKAQINNQQGHSATFINNINNLTITCYNTLEEKFVKFCNNKNILVEKGDVIPYVDKSEKNHKYFCDFKIKEESGKWRLIETKGYHTWWKKDLESGKAVDKIRAAKQFSKDNNYEEFIILLSSQLKKSYISRLQLPTEYSEEITSQLFVKNNNNNSILFKENVNNRIS